MVESSIVGHALHLPALSGAYGAFLQFPYASKQINKYLQSY